MKKPRKSVPGPKGQRGGKVVLLSGGNPQIAKADGDAPVQAYIAAMPGWKRGVGEHLDALIVRAVPKVRKAVKWNSPMYGIEGQGWFLSFHTFTRYVKVSFFRGASLRPIPPGPSKHKDVRYFDVREDEPLDEAQMTKWVKQAARLPGWIPLFLAMVLAGSNASADVVRVGDLNTRQIRALDRDRTVVFLQGGMLEEHGPYLPAFTDGILSERLTSEVANGVVAKKPEWTALLFPPVSVGASGYNEIGRQFVFPGTYAVRPSTLRAIYMDLANQLGEQGFKWIMIVHVHGSPLHIAALDEAGDYFRDTYGGHMVNLWGLLPVIGGWGSGMSGMTDAEKNEDGVSLHAGADEHSLMLHLQPSLVAADVTQAPPVTGSSYAESVAAATQKDWPGYIGAPRVGNAALGRRIWTSFSSAALKTTIEILDGTDPAKYPRYLPIMQKNPSYQEWIAAATERDRAFGERQQAWNARRTQDAKGEAAAQLAGLEAAWNKAYLDNDAAALDRLLADDVVIFVPRTRSMSKPEGLAALKDGTTTFTRFETSELRPRVTGDLAVVTGRLQRTRSAGPSDDWQFRKVYRRHASGWQVINYFAWESPK